MLQILLFVASISIIMINGECPQMSDIRVMYDDLHFTCAAIWPKKGDPVPINACNGNCFESENTYYIPIFDIF